MAMRVARKESHNYYAVLGLAESASTNEIRVAYKRKALSTHPDKGGSSAEFRLVVRAFEVLFSGHARASYDAKLRQQACAMSHSQDRPGQQAKHKHSPKEKLSAKVPSPTRTATAKARGRRRKSQMLERCLRQLEGILKDCPYPTRLEQIKNMSQQLRTNLLSFMERSKQGGHDGRLPDCDGRVSVGPGPGEGDGPTLSIEDQTASPKAEAQKPDRRSSVEEPAKHLDKGRVSYKCRRRQKSLLRGIYSIAAKNQVYYESRIVHRNLCFASRVSRNLEDVVNFHTVLAMLRQRMVELEESDSGLESSDLLDRLKGSVMRAMQEVEGLSDIGLSYQVVVDARPWIGKMLYSPRMHCAEKALDVWQRAERVRLEQGWPGIRAVWSQWMQAERRSCWAVRTRSAQEAEALVRRAESVYSANRLKRQALREKREAAQKRRQTELEQRERRRAERMQARLEHLVQTKLARCVLRAEALINSLLAKERAAHRQVPRAAAKQSTR
ncbi:DJA6 [Symbiodinium natans]|uniref:DJA6 protein n=1 Tax=Symbiodinium natans TaxID=878477 RepID=A0A812V1J1_9DINO|nr:DJA6 [Symbiodinium natans]